MSIEAMKQALEALETLVEMTGTDIYRDAKKALRQAIATEESSATQEPVAACVGGKCPNRSECEISQCCLYTHPQPKAEESSATQEPVAWEFEAEVFWNDSPYLGDYIRKEGTPLYTHPQPKAEQEPKKKAVGVVLGSYGEPSLDVRLYAELPAGTELWPDAQVQQEPKREPLTEDQALLAFQKAYDSTVPDLNDMDMKLVRAIEAAHGIKGAL